MKKFLLLFVVALSLQVHAQTSTGKNEALEALGGSGGLLLYDSYLVIGEAADAYSREAYSASEVEKIVQEQIGGIETVQQQYDALLSTKFLSDPQDREFLRELRDAFDLVLDEGRALVEYVNSESDEAAAIYDENRKAAWAKIKELLGFED